MKTAIIESKLLTKNMKNLSCYLTKSDTLIIITDTGMIPVSCYRSLTDLQAEIFFVTVAAESTASMIYLLMGSMQIKSDEGIYIITDISLDAGILNNEYVQQLNPIYVSTNADVLSRNKELAKKAVRTRRTSAGKARDKTTTDISDREPLEVPDKSEILKNKKFMSLLYAYCGKIDEVKGKETLIASAISETLADVSLEMVLRYKLDEDIPGLYDAIRPHFKELKDALK